MGRRPPEGGLEPQCGEAALAGEHGHGRRLHPQRDPAALDLQDRSPDDRGRGANGPRPELLVSDSVAIDVDPLLFLEGWDLGQVQHVLHVDPLGRENDLREPVHGEVPQRMCPYRRTDDEHEREDDQRQNTRPSHPGLRERTSRRASCVPRSRTTGRPQAPCAAASARPRGCPRELDHPGVIEEETIPRSERAGPAGVSGGLVISRVRVQGPGHRVGSLDAPPLRPGSLRGHQSYCRVSVVRLEQSRLEVHVHAASPEELQADPRQFEVALGSGRVADECGQSPRVTANSGVGLCLTTSSISRTASGRSFRARATADRPTNGLTDEGSSRAPWRNISDARARRPWFRYSRPRWWLVHAASAGVPA